MMSEGNVRIDKKAFGHFGQKNKECLTSPNRVRIYRTQRKV